MKYSRPEKTYDYTCTMVISCATVIEELMMPPGMYYRVLDFGGHINPDALRVSLQNAVDAVPDNVENIVLGYGLCSQAVIGLTSKKSTLIIPKADDCVGIFLGSNSAYRREHINAPGTYYLTKGWLKTSSTPFDRFEAMVGKYGYEKARRIMKLVLRNYTRLAFINTGQSELETYQDRARHIAMEFGLEYCEIEGSGNLLKKMIQGPWDSDFIIVSHGETVTFDRFVTETVPVR